MEKTDKKLTKKDQKFLHGLNEIVYDEVRRIGLGKKTAIDTERILWYVKKNTPIPV